MVKQSKKEAVTDRLSLTVIALGAEMQTSADRLSHRKTSLIFDVTIKCLFILLKIIKSK